MNDRIPCQRNGCPGTVRTHGQYKHCSTLCRFVDQQVEIALKKGNQVSVAELSALLGIVDAVNAWRAVVQVEARLGKRRRKRDHAPTQNTPSEGL